MIARRRRQVWQIASGEPSRDYSDLFIEHDIMLIGPGRFDHWGHYPERELRGMAYAAGFTKNRIDQVRRFCTEVSPGDVVLLRSGYSIVCLGIAADAKYEHHAMFDDVYGWDLQHTRRVIWQDDLGAGLRAVQQAKPLFGGRKQIPTFTRVHDAKVLGPVEHLFERCKSRPLRPLPTAPPLPLGVEEIGSQLFAKGLPNEWVDRTLVAIQRQRRLSDWYQRLDRETHRPQEHEVVAHMILPLLLALGWSEQLLAVEWHRIDLAAFAETPTTEQTCELVCEAKCLGHGLQDSFDQAARYVRRLELSRCRKILLTDGQRLYLYQRSSDEWSSRPAGYANIQAIRTDHIAPAGTNAIDTIVALTPTSVERGVSRV